MTEPPRQSSDEIAATLGLRSRGRRRRRNAIVAGLLVALAVGLGGYLWLRPDDGGVQYRTEPVVRGDLTVTVTATGDLQPVNQVEVGTEVSGTIATVEVDYNDRVEAGQVLARLDTARLEAQVEQSTAALEMARAQLLEAQANVTETRSQLNRLERGLKLSPSATSEQDLESAQAALKRAQAAEARARAQIREAQARLRMDQTNLDKAVIRAPIDGIVLERKVEPGQTVAASLQTPVLFLLAENLTQMELVVDVDEADVGEVEEGQTAVFTVDAYPEREFPARITQVRFAPQAAEGVVSYQTVLAVDNSELALRPGMTATANIMVRSIENALLVPNAALRFTPPAPEQAQESRGLVGAMLPSRPRRPPERRDAEAGRQVWVLRGGEPVAVAIDTGPSNGRFTVVEAGPLTTDSRVIVDLVRQGP